ncbi:MAG: hypothetical protein F9K31_06550 [Dokdonella sp.]|nr:MAG: hypothetical protein F9K31_06550 [Dokdonella sp.]
MNKRGEGTWSRVRDHLAMCMPQALTVREIAAAVDADQTEVRSVLYLMAKKNKAVRVVTVEAGPMRWRLPREESAS